MADKLVVHYFSDVLCVWAWIAQRRVDELLKEFGERLDLRYHYIDIFGSVNKKIHKAWASKGLYAGYSEHVVAAAENYENAPVNPKAWSEVRPKSSGNAHLILKAIELVEGEAASHDAALEFRKAFFVEAKDIGCIQVLRDLVSGLGLETTEIDKSINNGSAISALMGDYQEAKLQCLKGSPSYVLNSGRQTLYGNVGYRVLQSNVEELLYHPEDEASWC